MKGMEGLPGTLHVPPASPQSKNAAKAKGQDNITTPEIRGGQKRRASGELRRNY
jgi:hypothetical protein